MKQHVVVGDRADQLQRHARQKARRPGVPCADAEFERAGGEVVVVVRHRYIGVDHVDVDAVLQVEALCCHVLVEDDVEAGRQRHVGHARHRALSEQDGGLRDGNVAGSAPAVLRALGGVK